MKAVIQRTTIITIQKRHIAVSTANIAAYSKHSVMPMAAFVAMRVYNAPEISWIDPERAERKPNRDSINHDCE